MPAASTLSSILTAIRWGPGAKRLFSAVGAYDPGRPLPQAARGNVFYAEWLDEQTTVAGQRERGVTTVLLSNGGELELLSRLAGGDERARSKCCWAAPRLGGSMNR